MQHGQFALGLNHLAVFDPGSGVALAHRVGLK
jgi:hypothetical protein